MEKHRFSHLFRTAFFQLSMANDRFPLGPLRHGVGRRRVGWPFSQMVHITEVNSIRVQLYVYIVSLFDKGEGTNRPHPSRKIDREFLYFIINNETY